MKKIIVLSVIMGLFFISIEYSFAQHHGPFRKLGRGITNVTTSPFEFPKGIGDASNEGGVFAGLTWGVFQGTLNIVKRTVVGVYEIATFALPIPSGYRPILKDPEFFLEPTNFSQWD